MTNTPQSFTARVFLVAGISLFLLLATLLLWFAVDVFLLAFAGILLAIFLRSLSDGLCRHTTLSAGVSLTVVLLALVSALLVGAWLLAPGVAEQIDAMQKQLPQSLQQLKQRIEAYQWGRQLIAQIPEARDLMPDNAEALAGVTGAFSTTFSVIANFFIFLFIGLYLAFEPRLYRNGLIRLVPAEGRGRAREVLDAVGDTLRWWLIGKVVSMALVGVATVAGLWLLDIPLALTLGLLAALLTFIPNVGPILSLVPAVLLALLVSPMQALYVTLLYIGIQVVESYFFTPLLQKRTISLPPALTIFAQVIFGVLAGGLGFILAAPLAAALMVLVNKLYIEDTLHDRQQAAAAE